MKNEEKIKLLRAILLGVLADTTVILGKEGVLGKVTKQKKVEQMRVGKIRAQQLGIQKPEDVFIEFSDLYKCAKWQIEVQEDGFTAQTTECLLCSATKKMGDYCPCYLYCLNPIEGIIKAINPQAEFKVKEILWNGEKCHVEVT